MHEEVHSSQTFTFQRFEAANGNVSHLNGNGLRNVRRNGQDRCVVEVLSFKVIEVSTLRDGDFGQRTGLGRLVSATAQHATFDFSTLNALLNDDLGVVLARYFNGGGKV